MRIARVKKTRGPDYIWFWLQCFTSEINLSNLVVRDFAKTFANSLLRAALDMIAAPGGQKTHSRLDPDSQEQLQEQLEEPWAKTTMTQNRLAYQNARDACAWCGWPYEIVNSPLLKRFEFNNTAARQILALAPSHRNDSVIFLGQCQIWFQIKISPLLKDGRGQPSFNNNFLSIG